MVWEQVEPTISDLCYSRNPPNFIMIHCGGNSIGTSSLRQLQRFMKLTIDNIQNALPQTTIIWSQILPRQYYRHMFCHAAAENSRRRINSSLSNFIKSRGGCYIKYPDLSECVSTLYYDGTHLTETGQFLFLNTIQGGLFKIITENVCEFPNVWLGSSVMAIAKFVRLWRMSSDTPKPLYPRTFGGILLRGPLQFLFISSFCGQ